MKSGHKLSGPVHLQTKVALAIVVLSAALSACNQASDTTAKRGSNGAPTLAQLASVATNDIAKNPQLLNIAMTDGKALYDTHCSSCHGTDLKGLPDKHTPDLTDNDWMYVGDDPDTGGAVHTAADVEKTILLGIRAMPRFTNLGSQQENDAKNMPNKNLADMPAFSPKGEFPLSDREVADVTEYVLQLGGQNHNAQMANRGKVIFGDKGSCYDCHEPEGTGDPAIGSTDLTKASLYLYGSTREAILSSLKSGRSGLSPAFQGALKPEEVKAIAVYVFSQGGPGSP
jgi:cbb3-type cytochrome c oxidase subunit III